jgi:hypothetical protein
MSEPPWHDGYLRMFLSHSAVHKVFTAEVAGRMLPLGVSGFVAHDSMQVSQPWQTQIEHALRTAEVLVALLHPEAKDSAWCQQEIGWAFGRDIPILVVRLGADPHGFPGYTQWPSAYGQTAQEVARLIAEWLNKHTLLGDGIATRLLAALRAAGNYYDAEEAARALDALGSLSAGQWAELDEIFLANDQVGRSVLATRALRPLYNRASRSFPERS